MIDSFDASAQSPDLQALRRQARQRFIGAAVLVLIAVVAFPFLFDFQPRPLPPTVVIELLPNSANNVAAVQEASTPAQAPTPVSAQASAPSPTPTPTPAESQTVPAPRGYIVQAGSFKDKAKAQEIQTKLEKAGIKNFTQDAAAKDGTPRVRVRIGPFATQAQANSAAARMAKLGIKAVVMQP